MTLVPGDSAEVPGIAVVMVSYHTGPALEAACSAVLAELAVTGLVLVDNGNPPEAVRWLDALAAGEPRVRLLRGQGNIGFGRACNLGAAGTTAPCLIFLNPDTEARPGALVQLARTAMTRQALVGALLVDREGREQRGSRRGALTPVSLLVQLLRIGRPGPQAGWRRAFNRLDEPLPQTVVPMETVSGACFAIPRSVFESLGGFDPRYFLHFEDVELCRHARRRGVPVLLAPSAHVLHVGATSRVSTWWIGKWKFCSLLLYLFGAARV